jgi:ABC-2 type transport system permease protein
LSIFSKGCEDLVGNKINISLKSPEIESTSQNKNPFLVIFSDFDLVGLIKIIFSVLTIFLVTDSISGEKENGTLKLLLSHNVKRFEIFTAKFTANLNIVVIPLALMFIITALFISFQLDTLLDFSFWVKILLILISCLGFISIYVFIGLIVSTLSPTSSLSLIFGLMIWIILALLYPSSINSLVTATNQTASLHHVNNKIEEIRSSYFEKMEENIILPGRRNESSPPTNGIRYDGLPGLIGITEKDVFESWESVVVKNIPLFLKGQNEIIDVRDNHRNKLLEQRKIINRFLFLSPGSLLDESCNKLANTDIKYRDFYIFEKAKSYRTEILEYMEKKDAFGLKFFTQMSKDEMKDEYNQYPGEIFTKYGWNSGDIYPRLELNNVPEFEIKSNLGFPIELLVLIIMNGVLFVTGVRTFTYRKLI